MRLCTNILAACLALGAAACTEAPEANPNDVVVEDAWMRATAPGAPVAGGYFTLRNSGDAPDRLLSIRSPAAREVQIHEVRHEAGIARMRPLPVPFPIAADSTVTMQPGGMHLMFLDPARPIAEGTRVPATLQFERAGTIEIALEVRGAGAMASDEHAGH
jgi:copper(I)-binding protein